MPRASRRRIAIHEAGHVVAAIALRIPIKSVTIARENPHMHRLAYKSPHVYGAECLAALSLAGAAAEALLCGAGKHGDDIDRRMARDYLEQRYGDVQIEDRMAQAEKHAHALVSASRREIELIADALLRHDTLSGAQIADCLLRDGAAVRLRRPLD